MVTCFRFSGPIIAGKLQFSGMTEKRDRWHHKIVRSFRISEPLDELIEQECKRLDADFSSFMRTAAVSAMRTALSLSLASSF